MRTQIYTTYAEATDMTFIMQDTYSAIGDVISVECVGWYFGEPDEFATKMYIGNLKVEL